MLCTVIEITETLNNGLFQKKSKQGGLRTWTFQGSAFLIQIFLCWQKIADMNGDIFRSCWQMWKSHWQIYFSLIAHYQLILYKYKQKIFFLTVLEL